MRTQLVAVWSLLACIAASAMADDTPADRLNALLAEGKTREARETMRKMLDGPYGDQARFGLGVTQLLEAAEHLTQSLTKYGARSAIHIPWITSFHFPVGANASPLELSYEDLRGIVQTFDDDLGAAERTLSGLDEREVKLTLRFGAIRIDIDGDGKAASDETFVRVYEFLLGEQFSKEQSERLVVGFDSADVQWIRGYCHLMMGICEGILAYDECELFETSAQLLFARPQTPNTFLVRMPADDRRMEQWDNLADWIVLVHQVRLELIEPARMKRALEHFDAMAQCNLAMWRLAQAETDDDNEWIPAPNQTGLVPGVRTTKLMLDVWLKFLNESGDVLAGRKLVPFWRGSEGKGVNIRRVFTEPRQFDLVLWMQGSAAMPYLEDGPMVSDTVWETLLNVIGGRFLHYAGTYY